jgi:hypothetical protein
MNQVHGDRCPGDFGGMDIGIDPYRRLFPIGPSSLVGQRDQPDALFLIAFTYFGQGRQFRVAGYPFV